MRPAENHLVVSAGQADLGHVHRTLPATFRCGQAPSETFSSSRNLTPGGTQASWYYRTENAA